MTFLNRLRLRDNWPLWVAGAGLLLILSYLLYSQKMPLWYKEFSTSAVIYPLLVLLNSFVVLVSLCLISALILIIVGFQTFKYRKPKSFAILGVFILFPLLSCLAVYSLFFYGANFAHKESLKFNNHIYHLSEVTVDLWGFPYAHFVVYECDQTGILCSATYRSEIYSLEVDYNKIYSTRLITDPANSQLYLQISNERFLVTP
jgi:hypothetical protein